MTKRPEFLRDLGDSDVKVAAKKLFNGTFEVSVEGYVVTLPDFEDLGPHVKEFIMKAVGQGTVRNILDNMLVVENSPRPGYDEDE